MATSGDIGLDVVLRRLGFQPADVKGDFKYEFANFRLEALVSYDPVGGEHFWFYAHFGDGRTIEQIDFKIPGKVTSFEQGHALISYYLRGHTIKSAPPWVSEGRKLSQHLPWLMDAPITKDRCEIERDWFRPALRSLRDHAQSASPDELIEIRFDGRALTLESDELFLTMPARGAVWEDHIWIAIREIKKLPTRLKRIVTLEVFENWLTVGGNRLRLSMHSYLSNFNSPVSPIRSPAFNASMICR
jgi:hypothetical protein